MKPSLSVIPIRLLVGVVWVGCICAESAIRVVRTVMHITEQDRIAADARSITAPVMGKEDIARCRKNRAPEEC